MWDFLRLVRARNQADADIDASGLKVASYELEQCANNTKARRPWNARGYLLTLLTGLRRGLRLVLDRFDDMCLRMLLRLFYRGELPVTGITADLLFRSHIKTP